jgi:hypothetical protein
MKHAFVLGIMKSHIYIGNIKNLYLDTKKTKNNIFKLIKTKMPLKFFLTKQKLELYDYLVSKDETLDTIDFFKSFFFYFLTEDNIKLLKRNYVEKKKKRKKKKISLYNNRYYYILYNLDIILNELKENELSKNDIYFFFLLKNIIMQKSTNLNKYNLKKTITHKNVFINENIFSNKYNNSLLLDLNQYFQKKNRF